MLGGLAVADRIGVARDVAMRYWRDSNDWGDFPEPDGHIGRDPWWWSTTVDAWMAGRARSVAVGQGQRVGRHRQ
jgi:hypothetical protein